MLMNGVELSDEEWKILSKAMKTSKSSLAKVITPIEGTTATSTKVYLPKDWGNDRVVLINLGKKPRRL